MYNRLFTKILDSSIWLESSNTRIVWITLLAAMDETGYAHFSATENLANRARVSVEDTEKALVCLLAPDLNSANPANEGRRIERVPGGFMILNAEDHRKTLNREIRREQTRLRVAKHRALASSNSNTVTPALQSVTSASASEDASVCKRKGTEQQCVQYCQSQGLTEDDGHWFFDKCEGSGWKNSGKPIVDYQATIRSWKRILIFPSQKNGSNVQRQMSAFEIEKKIGYVSAEINAKFKRNGNQRIPGDGIDELKKRRDELQQSLLS